MTLESSLNRTRWLLYPAAPDVTAWPVGMTCGHAKTPNGEGCPLGSLCANEGVAA